jgi:hypothetical protein
MGYTYAFDDDGTTTTESHSYPEPLLRYGSNPPCWLEGCQRALKTSHLWALENQPS